MERGAQNERVGNGTEQWHEPLDVSWETQTRHAELWDSDGQLLASTSSLECGSLRRATSRALDVPLGMSCRHKSCAVLSCAVLLWPDELDALKHQTAVDSENECLAGTAPDRWRERLRESRDRSDTIPGWDVSSEG